jgi:hypothetical protein
MSTLPFGISPRDTYFSVDWPWLLSLAATPPDAGHPPPKSKTKPADLCANCPGVQASPATSAPIELQEAFANTPRFCRRTEVLARQNVAARAVPAMF